MKSNLQVFRNKIFGEIRVLDKNGECWFIGKDIAEQLGYSNVSDALIKHVDEEDKEQIAFHDLKELGFIDIGTKGTPIINESGLYSLILSSKLPNAKAFKRWVTNEVLPSIRKTGTYNIIDSQQKDSYIIENPIERAKRWIEEQEEKQLVIQENQVMKPKADYFDALVERNLLTNIRDTAKELGVKEKVFVSWLIEKKYCYRDTKGKIKPYSNKMQYFELKEFTTPHGHSDTQTLINPKGREAFRLLLIKDGLITEKEQGCQITLLG